MFARLVLTAILLGAGAAWSVEPGNLPPPAPKEVDATEASRWGERVVVVGEGPRAGDEGLFSAAMAPPETDDDVWFFSVWGCKGCVACKELHDNLQKSPHLTPFTAKAPDQKKPWAYVNYYLIEDATQAWRAKASQVSDKSTFPILIVQPPRNGKFGSPRWVVDRIEAKEASGAPDKLAARIRSSVRLYCKKLSEGGGGIKSARLFDIAEAQSLIGQSPTGASPPFAVPPQVPPFNPVYYPPSETPPQPPAPQPLTLEQILAAAPEATMDFLREQLTKKPTSAEAVALAWQIHKLTNREPTPANPSPAPAPAPNPQPLPTPPNPTPAPQPNLLAILLGALGGGSLTGLAAMGLMLFRTFRKNSGKPPILDDGTFAALMALLQSQGLQVVRAADIQAAAAPLKPGPSAAP